MTSCNICGEPARSKPLLSDFANRHRLQSWALFNFLAVGTGVGSGAMWMAQLEMPAATPKDLVVESSGHLKPALGQTSVLTNSPVYIRTYSRYSINSKLISHHPCP